MSGAFGRSLERELPWLRALARRLANDDADDLVQETWLRAHVAGPPSRAGLRPWLRTILRNGHRMTRRAERARVQREMAQSAPEAPSAESMVAAQQLYALLDALLDELDAEDRELLERRFLDEQSAADIARDRGIPAATVRTRVRRALHRLRARLDERTGDRRAWVATALMTKIPTAGVVLVMKTALTGLFVCAAAAVLFWTLDRTPKAHADAPEASAVDRANVEPSTVRAESRPAAAHPAERDALGDRVRAALAAAPSQPTHSADEHHTLGMAARVGGVVGGCADLLEPDDRGRVSLTFHYIGAPDVGAVIDDVQVVADGVGRPAFAECLVASANLAELEGVSARTEGVFRAHYTVGKPVNNMLLFLQANPSLAEEHEVFARFLERGEAAFQDDDLATEMAHTIVDNPDLGAQLEAWIAHDGIDLAGVLPD